MTELSEDPSGRARKYISTLTAAFKTARPKTVKAEVDPANVYKVTDAIQRYLQDAQHYLDQGRATTALASVAYAEGLLDAMIFLELA